MAICRMVLILVVPFVARLKYYFAWAVSEACLIFQGFNFNGFEAGGKAKWDRYSNTRILQVEFSTSLAQLPVHWNTCTGNFLRRCEALPICHFPAPAFAHGLAVHSTVCTHLDDSIISCVESVRPAFNQSNTSVSEACTRWMLGKW